MNTIHDNLPAIQLPLFTIFDGIVAGALLLGVIYFVWQMFAKSQRQAKPATVKATTTAFVPTKFSLSAELRRLRDLQAQADWKPFALSATKLLKKMLERRFNKPFAFATGKELEEILQNQLTAKEKQQIHQFFSLLDPIKFAQAKGKNAIAEAVLEIFNNFKS